MKKLCLILVFASFAFGRVFVGIEGGVDMRGDIKHTTSSDYSKMGSSVFSGLKDTSAFGVLQIGSEKFYLSDLLGYRWFVGGGYSFMLEAPEIDLGVDMLANIYRGNDSSLGFILGVGSRFYAQINPKIKGEIPILARVGVSYGIASHHRVEFIAQVPIITWSIKSISNQAGVIYAPLSIGIGYKYIF